MTPIEQKSLPQSEVERIEREARNYGEKSHDLYASTLTASQISYFAGAKKEATTSMSKERERMVELLQWLTAKESKYALLYGSEPERFCDNDHDFTSEQVVDDFLSTQRETKL